MSVLDLSPGGGAVSRAQRVLRHSLIETRVVLRNGEQLLLALVIPIGLLVANAAVGTRFGIPREAFAASVIALGVWSTGFTSLAVLTGFERRYGVLERLAATPLRRVDLLAGKATSVTLLALGQAAVLVLVALAAGWAPRPGFAQSLVLLAALPLALVAFAGLALALAGVASAELTLGLANLVYLLGAAAGILLPATMFPGWAQPLVGLLPTTALASTLRTWADGGTDPLPLAVLSGWVVVGLLVARKVFRWTS